MTLNTVKMKRNEVSSTNSLLLDDPIVQVSKYEAALKSEPFDPNTLIPLIALSRHNDPQVAHKAIWALHRVFFELIGTNKVGGLSGDLTRKSEERNEEPNEGMAANEEKQVKMWVRERLLEYVEVLCGLMRDSEPALRSSALPLLFSLLPPLSASVSQSAKAIIHIPYFRLILHYLIFPCPSLRGARPKKSAGWKVIAANQVEDEEGVLPEDVVKIAVDDFWARYDDIRWIFFKEAAQVSHQPILLPHSSNLLAMLLPLKNLPREPSDINAFYISSFSTPPPSLPAGSIVKKSRSSKAKKGKARAEIDALPDWIKEYESSGSEDESEMIAGKKRKMRTSQLSIHASIYSIPSQTLAYTTVWETVLSSVSLSEAWTRRILVALHGEQGILGHFKSERRLRIADWLGGLVDRGGALAMLAINGLFVLMTQYNFEYPKFYDKLYSLLDHNLLHTRYLSRFFRLLDVFLRGSLMPATIIASFIKRLSRLALFARPSGIIITLPFIYNLFKRHPSCMVMLQRSITDPVLAVSSFTSTTPKADPKETDPYDENETSPLKSKAIDSSCWELATLQRHYLASISTLAKVFGEVFTKPEFNMEDFLDHNYTTLFETETKRKIRNPAVSVSIDTGLEIVAFPRIDPAGQKVANVCTESEKDFFSDLWAF
nr:U3 small nucleolar RNA-associated protein 19 [Cryptococcus depauperatus CBS 7855]